MHKDIKVAWYKINMKIKCILHTNSEISEIETLKLILLIRTTWNMKYIEKYLVKYI